MAGDHGRGRRSQRVSTTASASIAGWTGPAQVRKDSKAKSKATALDLEYVELCRTLSGPQLVGHDLKVFRQSLRTVLRARGLRY